MRSILFAMAALVVATNVYAAPSGQNMATVRNMGGVSRDITDIEHRMVRGFGGVSRDITALERQVVSLRGQQAKAERVLAQCEDKAVKAGKARNAFVARLGACVGKLREVKNLAEQAKKIEARMMQLEGRTDALEIRVDAVEGKVRDHEERLTDNETRTWETVRRINDLIESGPEVAFLAGPAVSRGGVPFNLGFGLSQPVADGGARAETEVLIGLRPEHLALTVRERVRQAGDGFVLGGNAMFLAQGRSDLSAAREVFLGAGPSLGWSGERFGVTLDLAVGPDRVAKKGWGAGGSAGLTLAVKF